MLFLKKDLLLGVKFIEDASFQVWRPCWLGQSKTHENGNTLFSQKNYVLAADFPSPCDCSHNGAVYQVNEPECV